MHTTEMKCLNNSKDQQQCSVQADKRSEKARYKSTGLQRCTHLIQMYAEIRQLSDTKSQKPDSRQQCEELDFSSVFMFHKLIGRSY
ncbi:hypothetical protein PoB_005820900 [Plakobranchus ocellatus]|uniref:Uncharacterized protein n=1 Tax=Plakobranchus ocellatus TaxID=259542 RepID=A0AAV4CKK0_9GAST|nr:hypothetical protein PoB_005820900 [Plakobranchus ocellatus]